MSSLKNINNNNNNKDVVDILRSLTCSIEKLGTYKVKQVLDELSGGDEMTHILKIRDVIYEEKGVKNNQLYKYKVGIRKDCKLLQVYFLEKYSKLTSFEIRNFVSLAYTTYLNYRKELLNLDERIKHEREIIKSIEKLTPTIEKIVSE